VGSGPWWIAISALKWSLATDWGVGMGFSGSSGEILRRGDLPDLTLVGDPIWAKLERRDGATPFAE
jgi:hypothetical protein